MEEEGFLLRRVEYRSPPLRKKDLLLDPFEQLKKWLKEAWDAEEREPNAAAFATCGASEEPSIRMILVKRIAENGIVFFTDSTSPKAEQIRENPMAALLFYWPSLFRQVRVEGKVDFLGREEACEYFKLRPRGAQIAAWASAQSQPLSSRKEFEERFKEMSEKYKSKEIPCPPTWIGMALAPKRFEFWQGQANRSHDRFEYRQCEGKWEITRLAP